MLYTDFHGEKLSRLGFGAMRLPLNTDKTIDEAVTADMVRYAIEHGVNYFDTAYPYHGGMSEVVLGRILNTYPREKWLLASKYPGHQIMSKYDPASVFEEQLQKCGVDHFDFYLLHNVYEHSMDTYFDPRWDIIGYFRRQQEQGRIRYLGFSTHAEPATIRSFLEKTGGRFDFCQIQLNYLDWSLQQAEEKVRILNEWNIPVWVMEPVRGGKLASLKPEDEAALKALRPDASIPSWAFRFLQGVEGVGVTLSGMSSMDQMIDNVRTYETEQPLSADETAALFRIAEGMKDSVPCTGCRYCTAGCPMGLDIPLMLSVYNDIRVQPNTNTAMKMEFLPVEKRPSACIGCGACAAICPQNIDIPAHLADLTERLKTIPSWLELSRQREEAANRIRAQQKEKHW